MRVGGYHHSYAATMHPFTKNAAIIATPAPVWPSIIQPMYGATRKLPTHHQAQTRRFKSLGFTTRAYSLI